MYCPNCGSNHLQMLSETETQSKGYGAGKGCLGYLLLGPWGLLCGLCGMGNTKTHTKHYWVCNNCGNKFRA